MIVEGVGPTLQDGGLDDRDGALEIGLAVGALALDANLAFLLQSVQRIGGAGEVLGVGSEIAVMEVIDVDVIAIQIFERLLALVADVQRFVGIFGGAGEMADLRGDDLFL